VRNILLALRKVVDPYQLGIQLEIESHHLDSFKMKFHQQCTKRVKIEVIKYWLHSDVEHSWEVLADAVEGMKCHGNVVNSLKELHRRATNYYNMQDKHLA
jgi:hypothetical protein